MKSANMPELIKSQRQKHLYLAKKRRQHYNEQCAIAKDVIDDKPRVMHYSFDYVQQVYYQFNAQQPGSIFFKTVTARKCGIFGIFGVSCEATSTQVNYLIDEADDVGKGANATISFLHHYLQIHGLVVPSC